MIKFSVTSNGVIIEMPDRTKLRNIIEFAKSKYICFVKQLGRNRALIRFIKKEDFIDFQTFLYMAFFSQKRKKYIS
ncbi:hypothetical protein DRP04_11475 [Archaeoglobales archaeon]|nr:MAG: hypothetical protein DRP04_11475 [Archaeoglobales archaeon]